jgi:hypothetical protein
MKTSKQAKQNNTKKTSDDKKEEEEEEEEEGGIKGQHESNHQHGNVHEEKCNLLQPQ